MGLSAGLVIEQNQSGATTSSHSGHSAQILSVPSLFLYSTRTQAPVIAASQFGHRPRACVSSGMEGVEGACDSDPSISIELVFESKPLAGVYAGYTHQVASQTAAIQNQIIQGGATEAKNGSRRGYERSVTHS